MAFRLSLRRLVWLLPALLAAAPVSVPGDSAKRWVETARSRLAAGDLAGADDAANHAVAVDPRDPAAALLASNLVRDRYGLVAALPWYDQALDLDPRNIGAMVDQAATLGDAGQTVAMLAVTRDILAQSPEQPMALYFQASLAARAGKWELSRDLLERTRGRVEGLPAVQLLRGAIDLQTGANERAIATLRQQLADQSGNRAARRLLGLALWRSGDNQGAIDILKPISDDGDAWVAMLTARACEGVGDRLCAAIMLDRAANPLARQVLWTGVEPGDALMAAGKWSEAAKAYTQASNLRFTVPLGMRLIDALRRSGDTKAADVVTDTLVSQNPVNPIVLRFAASDALVRRDWPRAAGLLDRVRERSGSGDGLLLSNLGWAWWGMGRRADARDVAAQAYALAPGNAAIAASYGWFLAQNGDKPKGIALLQKAVAIAPDAAPYRASLAAAQRR